MLADILATGGHRLGTEIGGVGAHIGDVARLVQPLRHHHGFLHAKTQPGTRSLLQGRGDKRGRRLGPGGFVLALAHRVGQRFQLGHRGHGRGFVGRVERLATLLAHLEPDLVSLLAEQVRVYLPVLLGHKGVYFPFPLNHQSHRDGLYPAGRQPPGHLRPQQG